MIECDRWKKIVQNMPGAEWTVTLSVAGNPDIVHAVRFVDTADTGGLIVGTVPPCHVLIPSSEAPPTKVRITAAGNNCFAEILEGSVACGTRQLFGSYNRFDWRPLSFGECTVTIGFRED
jgi:hypothetical protein